MLPADHKKNRSLTKLQEFIFKDTQDSFFY